MSSSPRELQRRSLLDGAVVAVQHALGVPARQAQCPGRSDSRRRARAEFVADTRSLILSLTATYSPEPALSPGRLQ